MTEREKMVTGELYNAMDPELVTMRERVRHLFVEFNQTGPDHERRAALVRQIFDRSEHVPYMEPPFFCDYGTNIRFGKGCFLNFDCVILDVAPVEIGDNFMAATKVQLITATHPLDATKRTSGLEYGKPIKIGDNCWLGAGAIVLPGVTIGNNVVVGAGSVVTKNLPDNVVVAGNPARIIRELGDGGSHPL
ncbi:MAG TPA: sugar O-acetyltransferase [Symbiobacteriaceae bacterium]|nr:sugar O-acetyltransferase [Symbiobacteriaceae bacterium]